MSLCDELEAVPPYHYYVRHPHIDLNEAECVKVTTAGQLMVHSVSQPVLSACSFGSESPGTLCKLVQDDTDEFSWSLSTDSAADGSHIPPSGVHNYLLIAAGYPEAHSIHARIRTPPLQYVGDCCVKFVYYFVPTDIFDRLNLNTLILRGSTRESWNHWQRLREGKPEWIATEVDIKLTSLLHRIEFEVHRPNTYSVKIQIALDEIFIIKGKCKQVLNTCSFGLESATFCDYIQDPTDDGDWKIHKRRENWRKAGPLKGYHDVGYFIYMDSQHPTKFHDVIRIHTPPMLYVGDVCVEFAYHMWGEDIYYLQLYTQINGSRTERWKKELDQDEVWHSTQVDVELTTAEEMIGFEVYRGHGQYCDYALDAINITAGPCNFTVTNASTIPLDVCYTRMDYTSPVNIFIQYPFDFSQAQCPFLREWYQASVISRLNGEAACLNDKLSHVTVKDGVITVQTCLDGSSYDEPFKDVKLHCLGELWTAVVGSDNSSGHVEILGFTSSAGDVSFYTARYTVSEQGEVMMSIQGNSSGKLGVAPQKTSSTVGVAGKEFSYAFTLRTGSCSFAWIWCDNGGFCRDVTDEQGSFICDCMTGYTGRFCELNIDDCPANVCGEHGECIDELNAYRCQCDLGFTGERCEISQQPSLSLYALDSSASKLEYGLAGSTINVECTPASTLPTGATMTIYNGTNSVGCKLTDTDAGMLCKSAIVLSRYDNAGEWYCQSTVQGKAFPSPKQTLEVRFPARSVAISHQVTSSTSQTATIRLICQTDEANPSVTIQWMRNGQLLQNSLTYNIRDTEEDGNFQAKSSMSTLLFAPTMEEVGVTFMCVVEQEPMLQSADYTVQESDVAAPTGPGGRTGPGGPTDVIGPGVTAAPNTGPQAQTSTSNNGAVIGGVVAAIIIILLIAAAAFILIRKRNLIECECAENALGKLHLGKLYHAEGEKLEEEAEASPVTSTTNSKTPSTEMK